MSRKVWVNELEIIIAATHTGLKPSSSSKGEKAAKIKENVLV